jgi:hypothetical protein
MWEGDNMFVLVSSIIEEEGDHITHREQ